MRRIPRYIKEGARQRREERAEERRRKIEKYGLCAWCGQYLFPGHEVEIDGREYHATCSIMVEGEPDA